MIFQPEKPKSGILIDRCDRWTAKILEDFPVIRADGIFLHNVLSVPQNSSTKYIQNLSVRCLKYLKRKKMLKLVAEK